MFQLHFANRFETLADHLAERLNAAGGSPFEPWQIVVPSAAVQRRLTLTLARRHGVCANVQFAYLARWLWRQIARLVPGVRDESPFDAHTLAWRVHAAFGDARWSAPHPRLAGYLGQSDPVMRWQLARRVAELFEQYVTYRPDWLAAWALGQSLPLGGGADDDQAWQSALWRRLGDEAGLAASDPTTAFVRALRDGGPALARLPAALHVVALPALAPLHLSLLRELGQRIDVHLHALNPSREHWFEVVDRKRLAWLAARGDADHHEVGQRLLAGWGKPSQAMLGQLVDALGDDGVVDDGQYVQSPGHSLLARLQNAILELRELAPASVALADDDRSIELHVCHSPARELEVLHDRLLGLFAAPDAPSPAEVLVAMPDLEAMAPLIDAVFGSAPRERAIPYAITGRARSRANACARMLLDLLALTGSRHAATEVFALLRQPMVARRFGLADDDLAHVHRWLLDAGVHWGLDAAQRRALGLPALAAHTFDDGLQRLFLGHALAAQPATSFDGLLPAGQVEGQRARALGALWRFVERLSALRARLAAPQPAADWPGLLAQAVADFADPRERELDELRELHTGIAAFARALHDGGADATLLTLDVVRSALAEHLDDPVRGGVETGVVTFAAIGSLRSLPFEVVCVIGLDDGAFPSGSRPAEFDLMAQAPRRGDRQRRLDDRNLFLDLLLAARRTLHLSHTGRSARDNTLLPPSVLVAELLDTLVPVIAADAADAESLAAARARLVVEHPLQPFSPRAFGDADDVRLRSFRSDYAEALNAARGHAPAALAPAAGSDTLRSDAQADDAQASDDDADEPTAPFFAAPLPPPGPEWREVTLGALVEFFQQPCRYLLRRRLGVDLLRAEQLLDDDEPFVTAGLVPRQLAQRLWPALRQGADLGAAQALARAGTELPAGAYGRQWLERELPRLHALAERVRAPLAEPLLAPHTLTLPFDAIGSAPAATHVMAYDGAPADDQAQDTRWRLHAEFTELRSGGLAVALPHELRPREILHAWLQHLLLCASPPPGMTAPTTRWWGLNGELRLAPCRDPRAVLRSLLALYASGLRQPLYFFPKSAWALVAEGSASGAGTAWQPSRFRPYAEGNDPALRLALRGLPDPMLTVGGYACFEACAHAVLDPLLACIEVRPR